MPPTPPARRVLPGFAPSYMRTEVGRLGDGTWRVAHYAGDGPGFATAAEIDVYGPLTWYEALDVIGAIYDSYSGD